MDNQAECGDKVRDVVSGFEGIVMAVSRHLNGCDRIGVQPELDKEKKIPDTEWFDVVQVEVLQKQVITCIEPERKGRAIQLQREEEKAPLRNTGGPSTRRNVPRSNPNPQ